MKRAVVILMVVCLMSSMGSLAIGAQEKYPTRAITAVIPWSAGGMTDVSCRILAKKMEEVLGQPIAIVNKKGASGVIGLSHALRQKPDGYTIGLTNPAGLVSADLTKTVEFDLKKFEYLATINGYSQFLVIGMNTPYRSLQHLKDSPRPIKFGCTGVGASVWVYAIRTAEALGIDYKIVTGYPGVKDIMVAIMRGDVDAAMVDGARIIPGEHIPLFVCSEERDPFFKDVPTAIELGYPQLSALVTTRVMAAPPGTPEGVLAVLRDALWKAITDKEFADWAESIGQPTRFSYDAAGTEKLIKRYIDDFIGVRPILERYLAAE